MPHIPPSGDVSEDCVRSPHALPQLSQKNRPYTAFHYPAFRRLWIGLMGVSTGTWLQTIVVTLAIQKLRHRSVDVATFSVIQALTFLTLVRTGGWFADRLNRVRLLIGTHLAFALCASVAGFVLLRLQTGGGHTGSQRFLLAFDLLAFANGAILAVDHPTRQALLTDIVPPAVLPNAIALNSLTFVGAAAFGPLLSSSLVTRMGDPSVCWLRMAFMLAMVAILRTLPFAGERLTSSYAIASDTQALSYLKSQDRTSGWKIVRQSPELRIRVAILAVTGLLVTSYQVLLPVFAAQLPRAPITPSSSPTVDTAILGWMRGAFGAGALLGGLLLAFCYRAAGTGRAAIFCSFLYAAALLLFADMKLLPLRLLLLAFAGGFAAIAQASLETQLQLRTPALRLGRVMSIFSACVVALWPIGGIPLAAIADFLHDRGFGRQQSAQVALTTSVSLAICIFLLILVRNRRLLQLQPGWQGSSPGL